MRRKLRKQRIKEQEEYERHYEKIDTENVELKNDIRMLRDKIASLER